MLKFREKNAKICTKISFSRKKFKNVRFLQNSLESILQNFREIINAKISRKSAKFCEITNEEMFP